MEPMDDAELAQIEGGFDALLDEQDALIARMLAEFDALLVRMQAELHPGPDPPMSG